MQSEIFIGALELAARAYELRHERLEDGGEIVKLDLGGPKVETRWHLRTDGAWALHYLEFPPR